MIITFDFSKLMKMFVTIDFGKLMKNVSGYELMRMCKIMIWKY